jgi:glycosyltransferase involved in cell wall biosynthesis
MPIPTLCLCLIVKNETGVLKRLFDSIVDHLDYWVICDTGSTDGTQDLIREYFQNRVQGELHQIEFKNFGYARSQLMNRAYGKADWLLLADADFIISVEDTDFKKRLGQPINKDIEYLLNKPIPVNSETVYPNGYMLSYVGPTFFRQTLLVSGNVRWYYVGNTHEYITTEETQELINFDLIRIDHQEDGGSRSDKYERDITLLNEAISSDSNNDRSRFYLGDSYFALAQKSDKREYYDQAINAYSDCIRLSNWNEEIYVSKLRLAYAMMMRGDDFRGVIGYFIDATLTRRNRLEAQYRVVKFFNDSKEYVAAYAMGKMADYLNPPNSDVLFIDWNVHAYQYMLELGIAAQACLDVGLAYKCFLRVHDCKSTPDDVREFVLEKIEEMENC